ncbi:MAG: hemerythrin domain-containing protein [Bacteroidota bacterium]|nr:hemerythrin domain-containing protein [Bacteroidota bacterium]MDP4216621.1 hemerythrin domain-containing protein [Bacteroidota bacterium]MDP4246947.1 hemerythrin domain-containing protein [Bacteroidota bacterium]MDP4255293.1 hemerythrin domain-containing protein [Bacteroidota bacterium]MDP4260543.1 hemerythrin domain-containing protein [Bacteroidota bacterium]
MKDHPPIKRDAAIASFSRDHHAGLLLIWKIRRGLRHSTDPERIGNYVLYFYKADLEKHFRDEESWLFGKLPPDDELRKRAEADHQAVYALIADLSINRKDATLLQKLADRLEQHIRFEERQLFNHLQDVLSEEEMQAIAERMPNGSCDLDDDWKDKFWLS